MSESEGSVWAVKMVISASRKKWVKVSPRFLRRYTEEGVVEEEAKDEGPLSSKSDGRGVISKRVWEKKKGV